MNFAATLALSCTAVLCLVSCAGDEAEKTKPIDKTGEMVQPKLVGRIASVPSDRRFVVIQSYGKWEVSAGSILITQGADNRTANLLVTGEASGQHAAADIQSGTLEVGDAVYSRDLKKRPETAAAPEAIDTKATRPF